MVAKLLCSGSYTSRSSHVTEVRHDVEGELLLHSALTYKVCPHRKYLDLTISVPVYTYPF